MRILLAVLLAATLGIAAPARAQWKTVDTPTIKGAYGLVVIPEDWNGSLFIYAHGYSADERLLRPFPSDVSPANFTARLDTLFQASVLPAIVGKYAIATTTFRSEGWYVADAVKDIENLRRYFVKTYGKPKHTYLWGHSGGGMVTSTVIEYFPHTYEGAMPLCGTGAGARRNFDGAFDLRVAWEYVCKDVPGATFTCGICSGGSERCTVDADCGTGRTCSGREDPPDPADGLSRECTEFLLDHPDRFNENPTSPGGGFVEGPVHACFGDDAAGQARLQRFVALTQIPASFVVTDMFFASIGMGEVVHRRTHGKHPWGNDGVTYAPPGFSAAEQAAFNAAAYRSKSDPGAVRYMRRWYEPRGRTQSKVLTIHALDDGLVIPENETKYREAFEASGRTDQLVQLFTPTGGHCGFIAQLLPAITYITDWVEKGVKPDAAAIAQTSGFTSQTPGPMGLKVVERRQKGAPIGSYVCDAGVPSDCPAGTTCDGKRHRCR